MYEVGEKIFWAVVFAGAMIALYMGVTHQRIQWERTRGLLARDSYKLYWGIRDWFRPQMLKVFAIVGCAIGAGLLFKNQLLMSPHQVVEKPAPETSRSAKTEESSLKELKDWVVRLEARRQEYPELYCPSVHKGIAHYKQITSPSIPDKAKLTYLRIEYEKKCSNFG